jgi:hypothetical protein
MERKPSRDALARRAAEGYRLTADDHRRLLEILGVPPVLDRLFPAIAALANEVGSANRVAVFWEDGQGEPVLVRGEGSAYGGTEGPAELEAAREAESGVLLLPLAAGAEAGDMPWGALLVAGLAPEGGDRLATLMPLLGGALWAGQYRHTKRIRRQWCWAGNFAWGHLGATLAKLALRRKRGLAPSPPGYLRKREAKPAFQSMRETR